MAYGIAKLVAQQYYKFLTEFYHFYDGVIGFWLHQGIVGNIEVFWCFIIFR
jgi:hypothetical protein